MLKTKHAFGLLFLALFAVFGASVYLLVSSNINTLLFKQYEQKLKTLDDTLRFSLLNELNSSTIKDFAAQTRADFIIVHKDKAEFNSEFAKGRAFSSLKNTDELFNQMSNSALFDSTIHNATLSGRKALYKVYESGIYRYIIIVYPRILELDGYWGKVFAIFAGCVLLFFVLLQVFASKLGASFAKILLFLDKINTKECIKLNSSLFKELSLLNSKLYASKNELLKRQKQNKKQSDKIALKNAQLSSVISAISHELKNPLSVIELGVSSLKEQGIDDKTRLLMLTKIQNQSQKLDKLADKLNLVFNLSEQGVQKSEFELLALCEKVCQNLASQRIKLQGKPCKVLADELLIEQVLINLLTNALKYSQKNITLRLKVLKNGVLVSVKDSGIGIEQDKLKLITKKFYKINPKSENSFGIGLFLVKKILALHGTTLQIQSTFGKGSQMSFVLQT